MKQRVDNTCCVGNNQVNMLKVWNIVSYRGKLFE